MNIISRLLAADYLPDLSKKIERNNTIAETKHKNF